MAPNRSVRLVDFTETEHCASVFRKYHAEDMCPPSPAIRTPRRSGWAGGRGKYPWQRGSESPRCRAPVKRRSPGCHRNPPRGCARQRSHSSGISSLLGRPTINWTLALLRCCITRPSDHPIGSISLKNPRVLSSLFLAPPQESSPWPARFR